MASQNQLSRYGSITKAIPYLAPGAKVFLVCDSDDTTVGVANLGNEFPPDNEGVARVYTTIQDAVNACAADRGDVVLVLPGYNHAHARTDSWNVSGVHIIGLGEGNTRPIVRYTGKTDEIGIGASNIHVKNLRFLAATDSIARALDLDTGSVGAHIEECVFDFSATTNDFRVMIRAGQAKALIENNRFLAEDTAGSGRAISLRGQGGDYTTIRNNFIYGQFDTVGDTTNGAAPIAIDTTDTGDTNVSGLLITGNKVINTDTAASVMMRLGGGTYFIRALACENYWVSYDSTAADSDKFVTGSGVNTGLRMINNFYNGDSGTEKRVGDTVIVLS
jgi:hypothetical protein